MVLLQLSVLLMLASTHSHPHKRQADDMDHGDMNMAGEEECCDQKMVGEDRYFNIGYDHNGMTFDLNCLSPCIFEKEDQPGSKYCFAAGDMKVECEDDMDYTPTNRPRPTGEMTEGPDGETDGMTDDGMTEDPNGVTGGGEDDIEATVKSLIDAGTCDGVTYATDATTDDCGDAATSYYKEFLYNGKRVIVSNNIPDHPAEQDALAPNPNIRCAGWQFVQLEVDPLVGNEPSVTDTGLGTIGLAVTGGAFFNQLSNPDGSLAMPNEGPSLDSCLGHSAPIMGGGAGGAPGGAGGPPGGGPPGGGPPGAGGPSGGGPPGGPPGGRFQRQTDEEDVPHGGIYHYHGNLNCSDAGAASGANDPDMCVLLGYYLDGVPVYGLCKDQSNNKIMTSCYSLNAGAATSSITTVFGTYNNLGGNQNDYTYASNLDCNLDEASGALHPTTGKYSYFMTTDYPWIPIKFMASRSTICGFTP